MLPSWSSEGPLWLILTTAWFCAPVVAFVGLYFIARDFEEPGKRWQCVLALSLALSVLAGIVNVR